MTLLEELGLYNGLLIEVLYSPASSKIGSLNGAARLIPACSAARIPEEWARQQDNERNEYKFYIEV